MDVSGCLPALCPGMPVDSCLGRRICYGALSLPFCGLVSICRSFPFFAGRNPGDGCVWLGAGLSLICPFQKTGLCTGNCPPGSRSAFGRLLLVLSWLGKQLLSSGFFQRSQTERVEYDERQFQEFLVRYVDSLNVSYLSSVSFSVDSLEREVKALYAQVPDRFGLCTPRDWQHPKQVLFNSLYSGVGVLGYMGPFFSESQLNAELLPVQYPFTYIHEYAHLLGVSSEAEANFWAYQICIRSASPAIRYSGYLGLLPYVAVNAAAVMTESDYQHFLSAIRPEVIRQWEEKSRYWSERYSPFVGAVQRKVYDWFLKGNKISSGHKNYAQVIGMIISLPSDWWQEEGR